MSILQRVRALTGVVIVTCALAALVPPVRAEPGERPARAERPTSAKGGARAESGERPPAVGPWRIARSTEVARGTWRIETGSSGEAALVIDGARGLVLDLGAAEFVGAERLDDPSALGGTALVIRRCEGVVVRGGTLTGWRFAVRIEDSRDVTLEGLVARDLHAPRLLSSEAVEQESDVLAALDPTLPERTGAAIVVLRSSGVRLLGCGVRRGAIGVAAIEAPGLVVREGDLSYLSAFGIALWRSPEALIAHTRVDAAVRGSSSSFWRGAHGSAGLLVVDSPAARAGDSVFTRCGNGVVARGASAGLTLVRCDLSGALEHGVDLAGIEAPRLVELIVRASGASALVAADSPGTWIVECVLEGARSKAVALASGGEHVLARNWVSRSSVGLAAEGVAGLSLIANGFEGDGLDWELERCLDVLASENVFEPDLTLRVVGAGDGGRERGLLRGVGGGVPSGRLVDCRVVELDLERIAAFEGRLAELDRRFAGPSAKPRRAPAEPAALRLDRFGPWDPDGPRSRPAPRPDGGLLSGASWDARWFAWGDGTDPRGVAAARASWRELADEPLLARSVGVWRDPWGDGPRPAELPSERFGVVARARLSLEAGRYRLQATSDDGLALRVDGRLVLENWTWHAATVDRVELDLAGGEHLLELEYFQVDGPSALALELDRVGP